MSKLTASALAAALAPAFAVIHPRNTIPVLSNVLLEAAGDVLTITGTDLDAVVTRSIPAEGVGHWRTTLPARALKGLLAKSDKADLVAFDLPDTDPRCVVTIGQSTTKLAMIAAGDFPAFEFAPAAAVMFDAADLVAALGAVAPFMGNTPEGQRFYLAGAYLHPTPDGARVVATDGDRLARRELPAVADWIDWPGVIIPRAVVAWLIKHGPKAGLVTVELAAHGRRLRVSGDGGAVIEAKAIDASFPNYGAVTENSAAAPAVTVDGAALRSALELMAIAADEPGRRSGPRPVLLSLRGAEVRLFAHTVLPAVTMEAENYDPKRHGPADRRHFAQVLTGETWLTAEAEDGAQLDVVMCAAKLAKALRTLPKVCRLTIRQGPPGQAVRIGHGGDPAEDGLMMPCEPPARLLRLADPQPLTIAQAA